jgi:hypothetical protein
LKGPKERNQKGGEGLMGGRWEEMKLRKKWVPFFVIQFFENVIQNHSKSLN